MSNSIKCIADFCVIPIGGQYGPSVSVYVAECQRICEASGLNYEMHAYGTNIEGPWDDVSAVIKQCHERLHDMGCPRVSTSIRIGTRTDKEQTMGDKIAVVHNILKN